MIVLAEIDQDGIVKVTNPQMHGKKVVLSVPAEGSNLIESRTNWDAIWKIFKEADMLDIPRSNHEEILRDLQRFRGTESC